ncbi:glycosyl hydrolase [Aspergillus egyptiacus]|nr:glycosyl hydrolase [Aspergillus egyptiacus]
MRLSGLCLLWCLAAMTDHAQSSPNRTYHNPILPGWHSDPSCIYVPDRETFFCVTSTFIAFPGLPLYASRDLQTWDLASNIFNRRSQIPALATTQGQQSGIYAPTLRYRNGTFYLIVSYLEPNQGLVFTSTDPYSDAAWSDPLHFPVYGIDPDIFWDDDGTAYVTSADNNMQHHYSLDLRTGEIGPVSYLWNGTGGAYPEGPHLYRKDGYYYLLLAEGGTETNHAVTMARSRSRTGPWEPAPQNPVLTNRDTAAYFQTVGHADLFQDGRGNWWAVALSTRSGPEWENYPMGRETVLTPVSWEEGQWPVFQRVEGVMRGPLPAQAKKTPGRENNRKLINKEEEEHLTFPPGSEIPNHLVYWRFPDRSSFAVSPAGHPHTLRLTASRYGPSYDPSSVADPIAFIARRQTDTLFTFDVDAELDWRGVHGSIEAGISLFLTQEQHVDLSVVEVSRSTSHASRAVELKIYGRGNYDGPLRNVTMDIPRDWEGKNKSKISLRVQAVDDSTYVFSAALASRPGERVQVGTVDSRVLSGDTGRFTGTLVGVYASRRGFEEENTPDRRAGHEALGDFAYFSNWRYKGQGQKIDHDLVVGS